MDPKDKIAMVFDYLFGKGTSSALPLDGLELTYSKRTGKIKTISLDGSLIATFRPDGGVALTVFGAELLLKNQDFRQNCVVISKAAAKFVAAGRSVFTKHVVSCGDRVRPGADVAVLDEEGKVVAVGKAVLSAKMMKSFKQGVAVKVREGKREE